MPKRKKKIKEPKVLKSGRIIPFHVLKARVLRNNLLQRVKTEELKATTASIREIERWLNHEHFICFYCLKELTLEDLTCDHKTPLSRFGTNQIINLCICCSDCNGVKGEMTEDEYRSLMELVKNWEDCGKYIFTKLRRGSTIFKK